MKAYVIDYRTRPESAPFVEVTFDQNPNGDSKYATRAAAEATCLKLNRSSMFVGKHQCAFAVDSLQSGGYGIFCVCHPGLTSTSRGYEERA